MVLPPGKFLASKLLSPTYFPPARSAFPVNLDTRFWLPAKFLAHVLRASALPAQPAVLRPTNAPVAAAPRSGRAPPHPAAGVISSFLAPLTHPGALFNMAHLPFS